MLGKYLVLSLAALINVSCERPTDQAASPEQKIPPFFAQHQIILDKLGEIAANKSVSNDDLFIFSFPLGIVRKDRPILYITRQNFLSTPARYIPFEDMEKASKFSVNDVSGAGWRGTFLSHGKMWFDYQVDNELPRITDYNQEMPW